MSTSYRKPDGFNTATTAQIGANITASGNAAVSLSTTGSIVLGGNQVNANALLRFYVQTPASGTRS